MKISLKTLLDKVPYEKLYPVDPRVLMAALLGIPILIGVVCYFLLISGKYAELGEREGALTDIRRKIEVSEVHIKRRDELLAHTKELEEKLALSLRRLPTDKEIPELLEQISNMALRYGLDVTSFTPEPEARRDFYAEVPVKFSMRGRFHSMLSFFDEVSRMPRIVTVANITMKSLSDKRQAQVKREDALNLELIGEAITFRYVGGSLEEKKGDSEKKKKS